MTPAAALDAGPLDLEADLERQLGRPVHLVVLNDAPADLRIRVLRAQRRVVERDRAARIRFEVATRNEFFDLEPTLRAYRGSARALPVTDAALVAKKLAAIETGIADLRRLAVPDRGGSAAATVRRAHPADRHSAGAGLVDLERFVATVRARL